MKFNPISGELSTNEGQLLKKMVCSLGADRSDLRINPNNLITSICLKCNNQVLNTEKHSDAELIGILKKEPNTCLKVDFNQKNIRIITN